MSSALALEMSAPDNAAYVDLQVFERAADGSERLRDFIIELALTGKLGTYDPCDESAELLVERARLKIASQKRRAVEGLDPAPFPLPVGWVWSQPQVLGLIAPRNEMADEREVGFVPMPLVPVDYRQHLRFERRKWGEVRKGYTHLADGDLAVAKITPCFQNRKSAVVDGLPNGVGAGTTELLVLRPAEGVVEPKFLLLYFKSPMFMRGGVARMTGTAGQQRVPLDYFAAAPLPLPPIAEQKRIVAKVDQLMALCDELEVKQATQRENEDRLAKAALGALVSAETREELEIAWARVSENFDPLTTRHDSVAALSNAVLWLATHGRLGTGRASDESAGSLLEKIRAERRATWEHTRLAEMRAAGTVARTDAWKSRYRAGVEANPSDPLVTGIPPHWRVASLDEVAEVIDPNPSHRYPSYTNGCVPLLSTREFDGRDGWKPSGPNVPLVPREVHAEQAARCRFAPRDIILARKGRLGLARHLPRLQAFVFSHTLFVIKPAGALNPDYLLWFLRLEEVVRWLRREMNDNTGVPTLGKNTTEQLPVPIPPREEQDRIVKVIERAMTLCEQLEASLHARAERAARLAESLVAAIHD